MAANEAERTLDVLIVGAGFGGLYALHRARTMGFDAHVYERGDGVGGTWYWNRYPGARCDVESLQYSYQFDVDLQQEWNWSELYAAQPEILAYLNHVADRFDLRDGISLGTSVQSVIWDDADESWIVTALDRQGVTATVRAWQVIMATGCLSSTNTPAFAGIDTFTGDIFHTGRWPHDGVDFSGKTVAVIGTGSSAVQSIPVIAAEAEHLTVFQRTPTYTVPAHNRPSDPDEVRAVKARYDEYRRECRKAVSANGHRLPRETISARALSPEERDEQFERYWNVGGIGFMSSFGDLLLDPKSNELAADFVRRKISSIVDDPETAARLSPSHTIGCKRLVLDTDYFETFNRPNVSLVDVSADPIQELTPRGVRTAEAEFEFDIIVFATGFDAMTGTLLAIDIRGRGGQSLRDSWTAGPVNYLGLGVPGFPNLFTVSGPGSPSVLTNMATSIEQHVEWITDCIDHLRGNGFRTIEPSQAAADAWVDHVNTVADLTLFPSCNSWYLGANIPGKTRVFMPLIGFPDYEVKCQEVAAAGYEGFELG